MRRWKALLAGTAVAMLAGAAPATADTFVVDTTQDLAGTTCPPGACSIRRAVVAAEQTSGPDLIQVPAGSYALSQGPLVITQEMTIAGAGARATTIVATPGARVFDVASTTATMSHLTMSGGTADASNGYHGGDLRAQSSTVLLDHVRVTGGSASSGGGLANRNGSMAIQYSLIDHNAANTGGGDGGGILNFGGDGLGQASLTVHDSTIALNTARLVGGIIQYGDGGDSTALVGVTMAFNQTGDRGGAGNLSIDASGSSVVANSVFAVSSGPSGPAPNCAGAVGSGDANVADDASCNLTMSGDHAVADARLFDGLYSDGGETDVVPFYPDSVARDVGGTCGDQDQTDSPRPAGPACDAGAWELRGPAITSGPSGTTSDGQPVFTFSGVDVPQCQLLPRDADAAPCSSPYRVDATLPDGAYEFRVYSSDGSYVSRSFVVSGAAPPGGTPTTPPSSSGPTPGPERGVSGPPTQSAPPGPTPVADRSVVAQPATGVVLVRTARGRFVPLTGQLLVLNGAEIDATRGSVTIVTAAGERMTFSGGRFKIVQRDGLTTVTLSQPLDCSTPRRGKARAAASTKVKKRRLWGDGKGRFRTQGSYSAATVRGTKWLVEDTCTTTLTRVARGVVSVRDDVKRKTVTVKQGQSYTARAKAK